MVAGVPVARMRVLPSLGGMERRKWGVSAVLLSFLLGPRGSRDSLFSHPVAPVPVWRMTPERARAVTLEGPWHRKKDTKANNVGSV